MRWIERRKPKGRETKWKNHCNSPGKKERSRVFIASEDRKEAADLSYPAGRRNTTGLLNGCEGYGNESNLKTTNSWFRV